MKDNLKSILGLSFCAVAFAVIPDEQIYYDITGLSVSI
jgi:hypothetical protein